MKKVLLFLVVAFVGLGLLSAAPASAVCTGDGYVWYTSNTTTGSYYYVTYPTTAYSVYFWVPNTAAYDSIRSALSAAAAGTKQVSVTGSATACPTTGLYRFGGTVTNATTSPVF